MKCVNAVGLHQGLTAAGIAAICIEARQAKAAMGAMPNKTDRNDARGIAQIMLTGWYRAVHVKSPSCRSWRALLTARRMVLNKRRDVENGVRALLREAGLKVGAPNRKDFPARVRELSAGDAVLTGLVESLLSIIDVMTREIESNRSSAALLPLSWTDVLGRPGFGVFELSLWMTLPTTRRVSSGGWSC